MHFMPPPMPPADPPLAPAMVIDFRPDGGIEAMHRDAFPMGFLGKQTIRRASDIRHDEENDTWTIFLAGDEPDTFIEVAQARGFPTYDAARRMEVRWLEMARLHQTSPMSEEGLALLNVLRKRY